nr:hypothetical protein [uncultured Porphyromonas sp.]
MMNQTIRQWGMALVAVLCLATSLPALAQYNVTAGRSTPAPSNSYGDSKRFVVGGNFSFWHNDDNKTTAIALSPGVMYLLNEDLGFGANLSLQNLSRQGGNSVTYFLLRPFARYYFAHTNPLHFYLDGGLGVSSGGGTTGFEIGVRPGVSLELSSLVHLNILYGFAGYRNKFAFSAGEGTSSSGFGISLSPANLMFGFEFHF